MQPELRNQVRWSGPRKAWCASLLPRVMVLALAWWIISGGAPQSWYVGAPAVVAAAAASHALRASSGRRVRLAGLLRFIPVFVWRSLLGGIDVAWRSLHPRLPISPAFERYRLRVPSGPARVLFAGVVNLLPGTIAVRLDEDTLLVHVLVGGRQSLDALPHLERLSGAIFGQRLDGPSQAPPPDRR